MTNNRTFIWSGLLVMASTVYAQNTFPSSGNVGIGTANPQSKLEIASGTEGQAGPVVGVQIEGPNSPANSNSAQDIDFGFVAAGSARIRAYRGGNWDTYLQFLTNSLEQGSDSPQVRMAIDQTGNVGIGTTTPGALLNVGSLSNSTQAYGGYPGLFISYPTQHTVPTAEIKFSPANPGCAGCMNIAEKITVSDNAGSSKTNYGLWIDSNSAATNYAIYANSGIGYFAGNVGIGTTSPQAKLEINGSLRFTADGSVQTTAWTGVLCGGDYAESVDVTGDRTKYGPGDVLVIDPDDSGKFFKSSEPYSTAVLGIYSTKPGAIGRRQNNAKSAEEVPMAMIGIVPTKVSAENGPIKPGDLLVTSSTPGYAMRGTDRSRLVGAVIGKALGRLDSGTGVIEIGVTLQ